MIRVRDTKYVLESYETIFIFAKKKTYKTHVLATYFTPSTWSDAEIAEVANTTLANVEMIRAEITKQN